ncbi:MAG TPA: hypothetical protein VGM10_34610 [Actinocrinis sp.]|jgi:hypothetical protein
MTVESPYQHRPGDDPDALDPTAAGYPAGEAEPEEGSEAEREAEPESEHDYSTEHEAGGADTIGGAWPDVLGTQTEPDEAERTDEAEAEAESAESTAEHDGLASEGSAYEEEGSAYEEPAAEAPAPETVPDKSALEDEALAATVPEAEPAAAGAVSSGSLIGAEPAQGFSPSTDAAAVSDTIIPADQASIFVTRLRDIQVAFIDDPHKATADADRLLGEIAREFAAGIEARRGTMRTDPDEADAHQTEQLRVAVQRYRKLVDVLLSC